MKKLLLVLLALWSAVASAQFTPGQVLTAAQLNSTFALYAPLTGATFSGPLTVQGNTTLSNLTVNGTFTLPGSLSSGSVSYKQGATGSVTRTLTARLQDSISLLDFGADPTDTTDSSVAFSNFKAAVLMSGRSGHMPSGTYKINTAQVIDLSSISPKGIYIYGDGQYQTMLDLTSVTTSPAFSIIDTGNAGGGGFYSTFRDFGIKGNLAGTLLQLGKTDFSDALNEFKFDNIWVGNSSTSASAIGIQVNYVLNTHFNAVIAANNGHGDAWQINAAAFCLWVGGSGTYGDNGYHLTAGGPGTGAITGNVFMGIDHEVNTVNDVKIDTGNATANSWIGGTFVYTPGTSYAFAASAGTDNVIQSPSTLGYPSGTPTFTNFFNGSAGVSLIGKFLQSSFSGALSVTNTSADVPITINANAGQNRYLAFNSNNSLRWQWGVNNASESGANAGSNLYFNTYTDAGSYLSTPLIINRASGLMSVGNLGGNNITASGTITPAQTAGIVGTTTNNNANAGSVGEYVTANAVGVSIPTANTGTNITSISLTAGDWDVSGTVVYNAAATTTASQYFTSVSSTSATAGPLGSTTTVTQTFGATQTPQAQSTPTVRFSLASTTTIFLVATANFSVSTMSASGLLRARRIR